MSVKTEKLHCVLVFDAYTQSLGYTNSQLINANSSNNPAWGTKSFNINGSALGTFRLTALGYRKLGNAGSLQASRSDSLRLSLLIFLKAKLELEVPLPPNALTTARMNDIIDFQFGTPIYRRKKHNSSLALET